MIRILSILTTVVLIGLSITGCWSRRELNELAVASAIGIDLSDGLYRVSVQIVAPGEVASKKGGGYETPVTVYTTSAVTISEAIRKMTTVSPRKVYLAHLRVVIFGEEIARKGIGKALDYLTRDHEVREKEIYALIAKQASAEDTLQVLTHLDKIPAVEMFGSMQTMDKFWAPTSPRKLGEISADLTTSSRQPAIPGVLIKGKQDGNTKKNVESVKAPTYLQYGQTAIFRKDKLIGWLSEEEAEGYNFVTNKVIKTAGHLRCSDGGAVAVELIRTKTNVTGQFVNGSPRIQVKVRMEENISDVQCSLDLTDPGTIQELEKKGDQTLENLIRASISKVQNDYKTDIFGFAGVLHRSNPTAWKRIENNWEKQFPDVPVSVSVDVKIRNTGTKINSVFNKSKD